MASLDLSAAFDIVNINLLLKRLTIIGLPNDVINLISIWLKDRLCYVNLKNSNSFIFASLFGTVQGSILGPILYAIFVSPLFDIEKLSNFADDNFLIEWNKSKIRLVAEMQGKIERITTWLVGSGLKVNPAKTEICLFHKSDTTPIIIETPTSQITSKQTINVLGVIFDTKLQWSPQVANSIKKANSALNAIRLIKKFFNFTELLQLLTSNFYSTLYYNAEIWLLPSLKAQLKQSLLSTSAKALKLCMFYPDPMTSFERIHEITKRSTPTEFTVYKLAIQLFKLYNTPLPTHEWSHLNQNQFFMPRQTCFMTHKTNIYKVGLNALANRLSILNGKIPLEWLNLSYQTYKIKCKTLFLKK